MVVCRKLCLTCLAIACCIHISGFRGCCTCNCVLFIGKNSDKKQVLNKIFFIKPQSGIEMPKDLKWKSYSGNSEYYLLETPQQITDYHAYVKKGKKDESTTALFITTKAPDDSSAWNRRFDNYLLFLGEDKIPAVLLVNNPDEEKIRSNYNYKKKPLLVFFHGNGVNIYHYLGYSNFSVLTEYYNILIVELPGYASNKRGDFSKKTRNKQINEIYEWCKQNYADNFVVMGYSLGCHFAILLAAKAGNHCKHLFLANPFLTDKTAAKHTVSKNLGHTFGNIIVESILRMQLDNREAIKHMMCNIDIYYSCKDEIVGSKAAEGLYEIATAENNNIEVKILPHLKINDKNIFYYNPKKSIYDEIEKIGNVPPSSSQGIEEIKNIIGDVFLEYNHNDFPRLDSFLWTRLEKIAAQLTQS